ncbi:hypothetical protein B0T16DRAFT_457089 [Cercophora newfieldiana]|uniref:Uncharacterized protein n=1 Tax=Cercophora newfieldiana TaxID=92897 RepID=A0AA40CSK2_9PEZI|nr:hypothetical protein B0T16DRAFT_457089 [Cercophora newfieldiana]
MRVALLGTINWIAFTSPDTILASGENGIDTVTPSASNANRFLDVLDALVAQNDESMFWDLTKRDKRVFSSSTKLTQSLVLADKSFDDRIFQSYRTLRSSRGPGDHPDIDMIAAETYLGNAPCEHIFVTVDGLVGLSRDAVRSGDELVGFIEMGDEPSGQFNVWAVRREGRADDNVAGGYYTLVSYVQLVGDVQFEDICLV